MPFAKILAIFLIGASIAGAAAPAAPTRFTVKPLGTNAFLLKWKDNSKNETGWEIGAIVGKSSKPPRFALIPLKNIQSYVVVTNDLTKRAVSFQLRAYNGPAGAEVFSKPTPVVTVRALGPSTFKPPARLVATAVDDGRIRLRWKDNSTSESGYQIEFRKGKGKWKSFSTTGPDLKFNLLLARFDPGASYSFRVRAVRNSGFPNLTAFSNTATVKMPPFRRPMGLKATLSGEADVSLKWNDRSSHEAGYEIETRQGNGAYRKLGDISPDTVSTGPITGLAFNSAHHFRVRAFRLKGGARVYSPYSNVTSVKTPKLAAPAGLAVEVVSYNRVKITWRHNSARELGFDVQMRRAGDTGFATVNFNPANDFLLDLSGLAAFTSYDFRVRAYDLFSYSDFSATVRATTEKNDPPVAIAQSVTVAEDEAVNITLAGTDPEGGPLTFARGNPSNGVLSGTAPNLLYTPNANFNGTDSFTFTVSDGLSDSAPATVTITVTPVNDAPVATPQSVAVVVGGSVNITLAGTDDDDDSPLTFAHGNPSNGVLTGTAPDLVYTPNAGFLGADGFTFTVNDGEFESAPAIVSITVTPVYGLISSLNPPILANERFLHQIMIANPGAVANVSVTGLPDGLTFDPDTLTIRGMVTAEGAYSANITVTYDDDFISDNTLDLTTISRAPVSVSTFDGVNVGAAAEETVSVIGKFADPDTPSAVRVNTVLGPFDIVLFPDSTPLTVDNFLKYVDEDLYQDMFFHRAPANFVVQGGGFRHTAGQEYRQIPTYPAVANEPGLTNIRATVAMAKLGGNPNSATSQFFVNLGDNAANLDAQNGGFTVFGRVADPGMTLIDQIGNLPRGNYTINFNGTNILLEDLPLNAASAPATPSPSELVKVTSVTDAPILTYTVTSQDPAIATAVMNGTDVVITGVAAGSTGIEVTATDLDGLHVTASIPVTVP